MDYLIDVILVGSATYYVTELLTSFWQANRLLKTIIDMLLALSAGFFLYPHSFFGLVLFCSGNLVASILRLAIDVVTSKPQTVTRQRNF
jgi:hypothetical protein